MPTCPTFGKPDAENVLDLGFVRNHHYRDLEPSYSRRWILTAGRNAPVEISMGILGSATIYRLVGRVLAEAIGVCWHDLLIYTLALTIAVFGDLACCALAPIPLFWARILPDLYYLAIVFAGIRFGSMAGLISAGITGILHAAITADCTQTASRLGSLAMFAAVGLVAGWVGNRKGAASVGTESITSSISGSSGSTSSSELERLMPEILDQFRTPIASIQGAGFVLEDADLSQDKRRELVDIVRKECSRLHRLAELLDFTRSRWLAHQEQEVDVHKLYDEVIAQFTPTSRIKLRNLAPRDLPPLHCEPELIMHALEIVTSDAIRAIPQCGEVALSAHLAQQEMLLSVEAHPENLLPFESVLASTVGRSDLAIVRHVVEHQGGSVRFDPTASGGVMICMPLRGQRTHAYERGENSYR